MTTDLFSRSHQSFLLSLTTPRLRFDAKTGRLRLTVNRVCELPPAWVTALVIAVVPDQESEPIELAFTWEELECSLMSASADCPESLISRDFSRDLLPIREVIFRAGDQSHRLPNASSAAAFMARTPSRDPDEDRL